MKTTIESTGLDDQNRARREGAELWGKTKALLDELQRLQAQPAQQTQAMRQVKTTRANAKDEALHAAIAMVLAVKPLTKVDWRNRASFIRDQLERTPVAWGLPADYADTARERDIRLIRAALHEWEKLNGCYRKSVPLD